MQHLSPHRASVELPMRDNTPNQGGDAALFEKDTEILYDQASRLTAIAADLTAAQVGLDAAARTLVTARNGSEAHSRRRELHREVERLDRTTAAVEAAARSRIRAAAQQRMRLLGRRAGWLEPCVAC